MNLQTWLEKRNDAVSRELLHRLRKDEAFPIGGDDPNLLGLDADSFCGALICDDVSFNAPLPGGDIAGTARMLHERAQVVLYG